MIDLSNNARNNRLAAPFRTGVMLFLAVGATHVGADAAHAQFTDYSQAYKQNLSTRPSMTMDSNRYLYDRYFRNNVAVSPYVSGAVLGGTIGGTAYTDVVRPDLERRKAAMVGQAQYVQQRKLQGNVGYTANPGAGYMGAMPGAGIQKPVPPTRSSVGAYQNHWYGNWNR
ncbi:hypothetical protein Pla123a_24230 [Posidoniimonas polymericola]|uniref:Uncharacterized protein n=1 Tax=Posidoniimonas polymericola TaxID=2528002 RepID=A0A5C5YQG1_9BACT|nr:hypothetical protein [Posidoniimonas polymericola]TWT76997.1 hypothetical protein Pla123a_24230 [Posidoniimonas polymericola]